MLKTSGRPAIHLTTANWRDEIDALPIDSQWRRALKEAANALIMGFSYGFLMTRDEFANMIKTLGSIDLDGNPMCLCAIDDKEKPQNCYAALSHFERHGLTLGRAAALWNSLSDIGRATLLVEVFTDTRTRYFRATTFPDLSTSVYPFLCGVLTPNVSDDPFVRAFQPNYRYAINELHSRLAGNPRLSGSEPSPHTRVLLVMK